MQNPNLDRQDGGPCNEVPENDMPMPGPAPFPPPMERRIKQVLVLYTDGSYELLGGF